MICLWLRALVEFHCHLKWYQSKWTRGTQSLSCVALLTLKSSREELQGKASRKHIHENLKHTVKNIWPKNKKVFSLSGNYYQQYQILFQISYQTILTLSLSYSQTILNTFPDIKQYWNFQRVTGKQYYTLFQSLYQTILVFSESSYQIKL